MLGSPVPTTEAAWTLLTLDAPACLSEPAVWEPAEEVQEQQRVAEAVGSLHQLLPVLLQITPGKCPMGWLGLTRQANE